MKITSVDFQSGRISKNYTIELPNGDEVIVNKWAIDSENGDCDSDVDVIDGKEDLEKWLNRDGEEKYDDYLDEWDSFLNEISVWDKSETLTINQ